MTTIIRSRPVYREIASVIQAIKNCRAAGNNEWLDRHEATLARIEKQLPSGSGIDSGTTIERDECTPDRIVLSCGFHHMNECGMYDGWTQHEIVIRPTFDGIDVRITGRDRNGIKEYLGDVYYYALSEEFAPAE